jgi:chromosome segregation ATPase
VLVLLTLLLAGVTAAGVHLWRASDAWEQQADGYRQTADELGAELAGTRAQLDGTRAELEAVRGQLANANTRIAELANEKAQIGDDREAQRQLVDYQERVTEAAGDVALALDQCVQGQQQLITYLGAQAAAVEGEEPYEQSELDRYSRDVDTLCDAATEANNTLQSELER